jgi:hypothetical protein
MKSKIATVDQVPDGQFLCRTGSALFLLAFMAGTITVFGATASPDVNLDLWPIWHLTGIAGPGN